jgi:hypothetical protein
LLEVVRKHFWLTLYINIIHYEQQGRQRSELSA